MKGKVKPCLKSLIPGGADGIEPVAIGLLRDWLRLLLLGRI